MNNNNNTNAYAYANINTNTNAHNDHINNHTDNCGSTVLLI